MKVLIYFSKISPNYYLTIIFRPQLNYGDIIYERTNNSSFHLKWKLIYYIYTLAITVTGKKSIEQKITKNWVLNHFSKGDSKRNFVAFFKVCNKKSTAKFFNIMLSSNKTCQARDLLHFLNASPSNIYFWAPTILECNKINFKIHNYETLSGFLKNFLNFIRTSRNSTSSCCIQKNIKHRILRFRLSHCRE